MQQIFSLYDSKSFLDELRREIRELNAIQMEEFEERAAIMEFEGNLSREEAEWRALQTIQEKHLKMAV